MVKEKDGLTFEEALEKLEKSAEALKKDDTGLEASLRIYEEGIRQYTYCSRLLSEAKQKILVYDRERNAIKEME